MKLKINKSNVSIDHITLSSDDTSIVDFNPILLRNYKYKGKIRTDKEEYPDREIKTYKYFHEFKHKKTGNKLHVFVDRYNEEKKKTLYMPNISLKFFSSWESPLSYSEVARIHNLLTDEYNVRFSIAWFHIAIDLFFRFEGGNPIHRLAGLIKCGRVFGTRPSEKDPNTFHSHSFASDFFLSVYDKRMQLEREKTFELSIAAVKELRKINIVRIEPRFYNTSLKLVTSLEEMATKDFSFIYPQYVKFLLPDRGKLKKHGIHPKDYRGKDLIELRDILREEDVVNNFTYYLKDYGQLSKLIIAALRDFKWEERPDKYPLSKPTVRINPQGIKFVKH